MKPYLFISIRISKLLIHKGGLFILIFLLFVINFGCRSSQLSQMIENAKLLKVHSDTMVTMALYQLDYPTQSKDTLRFLLTFSPIMKETYNNVLFHPKLSNQCGYSHKKDRIKVNFLFDMVHPGVVRDVQLIKMSDDSYINLTVSLKDLKKYYTRELQENQHKFDSKPRLDSLIIRFWYLGDVKDFIKRKDEYQERNNGIWTRTDNINIMKWKKIRFGVKLGIPLD